jgi:hypothetical protein
MELTGKALEISLNLSDRKADKALGLPNHSLQSDPFDSALSRFAQGR